MNNTAVQAEGEFATAKTSVWWDIENCAVPKGWDALGIAQKLSSELLEMNYRGPLSISSYGNTNLIPNSVQQALSSTGIALNHVPSGRKDASDKKILADMFLWVVDNPAPANLMLITGDGDFSDALHKLRMRRYNILLAHPQQASAPLVASAKTTWIWRSLWDNNGLCYPSDSKVISSQAVSEQVFSRVPVSGTSRTARSNKLKGIYVPKASSQLVQHESTSKKFQKKGESAWFCKVCNVSCKSFEIFTTHLSGQHHGSKWQLKQNLPENMEMTNKVVEAGFEASAHCGSYSVVCPGQTSLDSNPKNATMVKKQTEALLDAKTIEESVQYDNDHHSQNKQVTETCTTSERSGREFWQDFKGRLESEEGAPLNVDSVFSELSRDSRVPKEVRECFEAILKKREPSKSEIVIEKLEGLPKHGLEMKSGEPENSPGGPTELLEEDMNKKKKKKKKSKVIEDGAEPYVCSLCSVICDSPIVFESHLKGQKHAAMIKKHTETKALLDDDKQIQEEIIEDNGHLIEMIEGLQFQPREVLKNFDCLEKQNKELIEKCFIEENFQTVEEGLENENKFLPNSECIFTELNSVFSAPKEDREWFDAIIKQLELSQYTNLTRELEDLPKQNLEMNADDPENSSHLSVVFAPEAYECSICNVTSNCPTVFESHLMGLRHAASVKKHAEVLFDDKKILEESLQEKDHPRALLQELWFHPEEVQESIKRVCQITKEQVDNESEHLSNSERFLTKPNPEFPEPKEASSDQLDSTAKSGEISLEDASKQKPTETENASERAEEDVAETRKKDGAAATQIRVCDWCNVMCTSQMDFESHLSGKKHAASMKNDVPVVKKHIAVAKKQAGTKYIYVRKNGPPRAP